METRKTRRTEREIRSTLARLNRSLERAKREEKASGYSDAFLTCERYYYEGAIFALEFSLGEHAFLEVQPKKTKKKGKK